MDIPVFIGKKEHRLQSDSHNIMLCRKSGSKWVPFAFWGTLEGAVQGLLTLKIRGSGAKDFNQLQVDLKQYRDELRGVYE